MNTMEKSKYVENWFVMQNKHGIISLMFNTTKRWIPFHRTSDTEFEIGCNNEDPFDVSGCIQEVEPFLPEDKSYLCTSVQEKDQITFYFIPMEHLTDKTRHIIAKGEN